MAAAPRPPGRAIVAGFRRGSPHKSAAARRSPCSGPACPGRLPGQPLPEQATAAGQGFRRPRQTYPLPPMCAKAALHPVLGARRSSCVLLPAGSRFSAILCGSLRFSLLFRLWTHRFAPGRSRARARKKRPMSGRPAHTKRGRSAPPERKKHLHPPVYRAGPPGSERGGRAGWLGGGRPCRKARPDAPKRCSSRPLPIGPLPGGQQTQAAVLQHFLPGGIRAAAGLPGSSRPRSPPRPHACGSSFCLGSPFCRAALPAHLPRLTVRRRGRSALPGSAAAACGAPRGSRCTAAAGWQTPASRPGR